MALVQEVWHLYGRVELEDALETLADRLLVYDDDDDDNDGEEEEVEGSADFLDDEGGTADLGAFHREQPRPSRPKFVLPAVKFDELLVELTRVAPAFSFELPPYFANNARAIVSRQIRKLP